MDSLETPDELEQPELDARPYVDPRELPTRFSLLKQLAQSPAHYRFACQQPQDDSLASKLAAFATDRKEALRFGTAVHLMLLGTPGLVYTFHGRRAGKAWLEAQQDAADLGCTVILNEKEHTRAVAVFEALRRHEQAMKLLLDGTTVEQRIDWTFVGKACRSTPDAYCSSYVADLKTTITAEPAAFERIGTRLFYHAQAALYCDALEAVGKPRPASAYVIAVEKAPPNPITILRFTERALDIGARLNRTWIERLKVCEATNEWPEYLNDVGSFDVGASELGLEFNGVAL